MTVHALKAVKDTSLYGDVYQHLGIGIAIYDVVDDGANFQFVSMNPRALELSKVEEQSIVGQLLTDAFPGAEAMGMVDALRRVHRTGINESLPPLHYTDERTDAWYRNDIFQLSGGRLMAMYVDVTDDVRAKRELQESETRYALLTESLGDGIYDWNLEDDSVYFSPSWKAQLGYEDHELESDLAVWQAAMHPDERDRINSALEAFLASDSLVWDVEFRLHHKDGHYIWIHSRATPVRDPDTGKVQRILGVHIDIDEHKRKELEAERSRSTIDAIFSAMPDLFFLLDGDGVIEDFRAGSSADLYKEPEDFLGRPMQDVLPPDVGMDFLSAMQEARLTGDLVTHEYSLPMIGGPQHYESRISAVPESRFAVVVRNVTDRFSAERRLEERMRETEGLYMIYQGMQQADEIGELMRRALPPILRTVSRPGNVMAHITIDEHTQTLGDADKDGKKAIALINDGAGTRGEVGITFPRAAPRSPEDQRFMNAAATAVGLWLRNDQAQRDLLTYQRIVANTQDQLALVDRELRYIACNEAYARRMGYTPAETVGRTVLDVLGPEHYADHIEPKLRSVLEGATVQFQEWRDTPDGPRFMNMLYSPYTMHDRIQGAVISIHDVTDLHEAQAQVRRAAEVFSSSAEAVLMTEVDGTITDVNAAFTDICGYEVDESVGQKPSMLKSGRHDGAFFAAMFARIREHGSWRGEIWNRRKNGEIFPCLMTVSPVRDENGEITGYVGVFSDITQIKENEQRLEILANHDPLTGLPNRTQLSNHLDGRVRRAALEAEPFTIMFIDLDRFKAVNDSLGHRAGDDLLQQVAKRLLGVLRVNDLLSRVGGDEFVAVLPGIDSVTNAALIAEKIIASLTSPFCVSAENVEIGASIGICFHPADGVDADTLLRNADTAMYQAKGAGRSTWRCYDSRMTEAVDRHWTIVNALPRALAGEGYEVVYQPKFDMKNGTIVGLEALSRWHHPGLGDLDTREFIGAIEQAGHIWDIDLFVLEAVCQQIGRWREDGIEPGRVAVNISGRTLADDRFIERLSALLGQYGIAGRDISLELTESALDMDTGTRMNLLEALVNLDVGLSADDFGTGSTALAAITHLPVTELKIDSCFVQDAVHDPIAATIARTIAAMGQSLKLAVVAEGVENEEQAAFVGGLGPLQAQGNYYAKALNTADCTALLRASNVVSAR